MILYVAKTLDMEKQIWKPKATWPLNLAVALLNVAKIEKEIPINEANREPKVQTIVGPKDQHYTKTL